MIERNAGTGIRNLRGMLPEEMAHDMNLFDDHIKEEYDYVLYVKSKRADFIEEQLEEAEITFKRFEAIEPKRTFFALSFPVEVLDSYAEDMAMRVRLLEYNDAAEFKQKASSMFEQFNARQKHVLLQRLFEDEMDLKYYSKVGIIKQHFPLHSDKRHEIVASWDKYKTRLFFGIVAGKYLTRMQPINFIAKYYGEKIAFYFAWLYFYTSQLLIPAVFGSITAIIMAVEQDLNNRFVPFYCFFIAIWVTVFSEQWKRR
jgi:hypothetical protein